MAGGFRANIFDPLLIVAQIVAMQCSFYAFMGLWILLADIIGGIQPSVEQILDYRVSAMAVCVCVCIANTLNLYLCEYSVAVTFLSFRSLKVPMMAGW